MNRTKNVPGVCAQCGGHFDFAAEHIGLVAPCPLCGRETELQLATPEIGTAIPRRMVVWTLVTVLVLVAGFALCVLLLKRAERLADQNRPGRRATVDAPANSNLIPGYSVSPIRAEKGADGAVYAVGEVVNTRNQAVENFELQFQIADADGKPLGVGTLSRKHFAPGERWTFRERIPNPRAASFVALPPNSAAPAGSP